ncbi:PREDICTED: lymphoid-restricted membrane protein-like, partial [Eurypyga helias]|uniref:lymphoid-restricted membrane protein-like n=1 Tax=Eurypyga helias TaxID=54383 RepID=UPI000528157E
GDSAASSLHRVGPRHPFIQHLPATPADPDPLPGLSGTRQRRVPGPSWVAPASAFSCLRQVQAGVLVLEPLCSANEGACRDLAGRGGSGGAGTHPGAPAAAEEELPTQPLASEVPGTDRQELAVRSRDSDGTEEDAEIPEEQLLSFPSELSVLERLGLHRVALTEQDVEAAFAHLALAFRCDVFTLRQRVQVEKRARDAAEENIQEELRQCRAALERLGPSCADTGCKEMLEQLERSLAVLAASVERATSAAEKLGAVHQEARMIRAAEVMVQHVENLKRHHMREHAELEEMKRLIQQNSRNRQLAETQDDTDPRLRPHPLVRTFQQGSARRRVSIAVIPKQLLVQAVPGGAVAAVALPPAALLAFLLAASPQHRLPPPCPRP